MEGYSKEIGVMAGRKSMVSFIVLFILHVSYVCPSNARYFRQSGCLEKPLELREEMASVILSGTVKEIMPDSLHSGMYMGRVEVKRVFKGEKVLESLTNARGVSNSPSKYSMVMVKGFGDLNICVNNARVRDTRIFLLNKVGNGELRLNSSIEPITVINLVRTEAAVEG
ncbi:hypothetical protein CHS0354_039136 [Potamilus streckersoni]|uniref:NtA domain-containing protein n=1 Tax=Potamilus streckersoni TaxID=2493646 RepID=A0AAE0WB47_9BIVA|nr:hypothetical protein CHS0354_039136 [Potamilus streckersoni]